MRGQASYKWVDLRRVNGSVVANIPGCSCQPDFLIGLSICALHSLTSASNSAIFCQEGGLKGLKACKTQGTHGLGKGTQALLRRGSEAPAAAAAAGMSCEGHESFRVVGVVPKEPCENPSKCNYFEGRRSSLRLVPTKQKKTSQVSIVEACRKPIQEFTCST